MEKRNFVFDRHLTPPAELGSEQQPLIICNFLLANVFFKWEVS